MPTATSKASKVAEKQSCTTLTTFGDLNTIANASVLSVNQPKETTVWTVTYTIQFNSKEDADDFREDMTLLKDPSVIASFKEAAQESKAGKARPIEELYKKYGV